MRKVGPTFRERVFVEKPVSKFTVATLYERFDLFSLMDSGTQLEPKIGLKYKAT